MRVRRFCCLLPLVLSTGPLNRANFYAEANLHWIMVALLVFFAATGIVLYFRMRQKRQHSRDTAELAGLSASNVALGEHQQRLLDQLAETRMALEVANAGTFSIDLIAGTITWSDEFHRIYGVKPGEFGGRVEDWLECVFPEDRSRALAEYPSKIECVSGASSQFRIRRRDNGEVRWIEARCQVLFDSEKRRRRMVGINTDVTERLRANEEMRALEEQFRHAQKMEAIGRLASGVAHDINNLLMVIQSYTEMLQDSLPAHDTLRENTRAIMKAAERGGNLTGQLLAFSRKQNISPVVLDLNAVIEEAAKMLRQLIGEDIEFRVDAAESLWAIKADPDQIVQVLMNLCVNCRDAMPQGGTLTITTGNVSIQGSFGGQPCVSPGEYVRLSVSDTGTGISKELQEHIFEPFFTTKEVGKGTGLGLAMVYGTVKQCGGHVLVDSEPGQGTCFTIYLPNAKGATAALNISANAEERRRGTGNIIGRRR